MTKFSALLLLLAANVAVAAPADWTIQDAPYRAVVRLEQAPKTPAAGSAIELPEFGHTLPGLADCVLTDNAGQIQPVAPIWRGEGQTALLLAQELKPGADYFLYFGGGKHRPGKTWTPTVSLLLETRRLPPTYKPEMLNSGKALEGVWTQATDSDGAGWVEHIFTGPNPFGPSRNFLAHYTGYLRTDKLKELTLYTQSSDASFVFVNNNLAFGWPGRHGGHATAGNVPTKTVPVDGPLTRIDYYQAKNSDDAPGAVLGWVQDKKFTPIPTFAWLHPGTSKIVRLEDAAGHPAPVPAVKARSVLGFGDEWFYEVACALPEDYRPGWTVRWEFEDGTVSDRPELTHIVVGNTPYRVAVRLQRGGEQLRALRRLTFPETILQASINNGDDLRRYLTLLAQEPPVPLPLKTTIALFNFAQNFGTADLAARYAGAYLKLVTNTASPLWLPAEIAWLRGLAQTNPTQALLELRRIDPLTRKRFALQLDALELDILVFSLRDPAVIPRATVIATQFPKSASARLAGVRIGDYYRITGQIPEAIAQYRKVQNTIVEESAGRKLPAQDRAYSITVTDLLVKGHRDEAEAKVIEWETAHPLAKLGSDLLLLRARMLMQFGRWREALLDIESFEKLQPDSPYQIDAAFYRARVLYELGQKDEARKLWTAIFQNYPRHDLAGKSREWAAKS